MRIVIADYSGHPFQVHLSRELSRRKHEILHLYFSEFQTPKGRLTLEEGDPENLNIEGVSLGRPFEKYSFVRRRQQEKTIGRRFLSHALRHKPDVVIGSNLPLDALNVITAGLAQYDIPFVFWQQDIYSTAIRSILSKKLGYLGHLIGWHYAALERRLLNRSSAIVVISPDFEMILRDEFRVTDKPVYVVENWAPNDEITPKPKVNAWASSHGLLGKEVVLYTGTIGMKHDPGLLLLLAQEFAGRPDTLVVVTSEGPAADWLAAEAGRRGLTNLKILPFQPFDVYPDVLASADILVSILEADAGIFSVPSKVLSYLCSGRAIVLSAPPENLASRIIARSGAGAAVRAGDASAFVQAVKDLLSDRTACADCGSAARAYAHETFDIMRIGQTFESICIAVTESRIQNAPAQPRPVPA